MIYATSDVGLVRMMLLKSNPSADNGESDSALFLPRADKDLAECLGLAKLEPAGEISMGNGERELKLLAY